MTCLLEENLIKISEGTIIDSAKLKDLNIEWTNHIIENSEKSTYLILAEKGSFKFFFS